MQSHLVDPTSPSEEQRLCANTKLLEKRGMVRLIVHLTGSVGGGISLVLKLVTINVQAIMQSVFIHSATTNSADAKIKGDAIHSTELLRNNR